LIRNKESYLQTLVTQRHSNTDMKKTPSSSIANGLKTSFTFDQSDMQWDA